MARLKHIAIRTQDVEKTARFYREVFGLRETGVGQSGVYLTDGYLNIAILKLRPAAPGERLRLGLDHFGFQVDDVASTVAAVEQFGGTALTEGKDTPQTSARPEAQSYFEVKCLGPDEQVFDVSAAGWAGTR